MSDKIKFIDLGQLEKRALENHERIVQRSESLFSIKLAYEGVGLGVALGILGNIVAQGLWELLPAYRVGIFAFALVIVLFFVWYYSKEIDDFSKFGAELRKMYENNEKILQAIKNEKEARKMAK